MFIWITPSVQLTIGQQDSNGNDNYLQRSSAIQLSGLDCVTSATSGVQERDEQMTVHCVSNGDFRFCVICTVYKERLYT